MWIRASNGSPKSDQLPNIGEKNCIITRNKTMEKILVMISETSLSGICLNFVLSKILKPILFF